MREKERIDRMIEKLRLAWHNFPEWRLCQLVSNVSLKTTVGKRNSPDVFFTDDESFEIELNRFFGKKKIVAVKEH